MQLARMVVDERHDKHQLQVRRRKIGRGTDESPGRGDGAGDHAATAILPFAHGGHHLGRSAQGHAEAVAVGRCAPGLHVIDMVLQILADAGQVLHHGYPQFLQFHAESDAGELQQLRRAERAGAQDHLASRAYCFLSSTFEIIHAACPSAFTHDARRHRTRDHAQIWARQIGRQIRLGRAAAFAVLMRDLIQEGTLLFKAVVVGIQGDAVQCGGIEKHPTQGAVVARVGHVQGAALAVKGVVELLVIFRTPEIRQYLVVGPAGVAERGPMIVVPAVAAHVEHGVDGAGTAQRLAARLIAAPPLQAGLRHGLVGIIVDARRHHRHHAGRGMDQHAGIAPAGFEQCHRHARVFRHARSQRTAGRAGAHDHVIDFVQDWSPYYFSSYCQIIDLCACRPMHLSANIDAPNA